MEWNNRQHEATSGHTSRASWIHPQRARAIARCQRYNQINFSARASSVCPAHGKYIELKRISSAKPQCMCGHFVRLTARAHTLAPAHTGRRGLWSESVWAAVLSFCCKVHSLSKESNRKLKRSFSSRGTGSDTLVRVWRESYRSASCAWATKTC